MCHDYYLEEGDIFTNSGHEVHGLTATDQENVVAIIQISNRFFTQYFPSLHKACFMTYVKNDKYLMLDMLRKMLLHILLNHSRRSFDYKATCIDQMIDVIKYLNQYFNLFAFDQQVTNFNNDNQVAVERISRIINYVYENYANKITLRELADREHSAPTTSPISSATIWESTSRSSSASPGRDVGDSSSGNRPKNQHHRKRRGLFHHVLL